MVVRYALFFGLVVGLLAACPGLSAQKSIEQIRLKSGELIEGKLLSYVPSEGARLRLGDSTIILIKDTDIDHLDFRLQAAEERTYEQLDSSGSLPEGWSLETRVGMSFASRETLDPFTGNTRDRGFLGFHVQQSIHRQVLPWLNIGAGLGIEGYDPNQREYNWLAFGRLRINKPIGFLMPTLTLDMGYGKPFPINSRNLTETSGGLLVYPAIGVARPLTKNRILFVDFGYRRQATTYRSENQFSDKLYDFAPGSGSGIGKG